MIKRILSEGETSARLVAIRSLEMMPSSEALTVLQDAHAAAISFEKFFIERAIQTIQTYLSSGKLPKDVLRSKEKLAWIAEAVGFIQENETNSQRSEMSHSRNRVLDAESLDELSVSDIVSSPKESSYSVSQAEEQDLSGTRLSWDEQEDEDLLPPTKLKSAPVQPHVKKDAISQKKEEFSEDYDDLLPALKGSESEDYEDLLPSHAKDSSSGQSAMDFDYDDLLPPTKSDAGDDDLLTPAKSDAGYDDLLPPMNSSGTGYDDLLPPSTGASSLPSKSDYDDFSFPDSSSDYDDFLPPASAGGYEDSLPDSNSGYDNLLMPVDSSGYDDLLPPAKSGGNDYDDLLPPVKSGDDYDDLLPPVKSGDDYDDLLPPVKGGGSDYDDFLPPMKGGEGDLFSSGGYDDLLPPMKGGDSSEDEDYDDLLPPLKP